MMKHFPSNFASIIRQKMTVILVALALLGLVGSVSTSIQSVPPAYAASRTNSVSAQAASSCLFYIVRSGDTLGSIAATHNSSVRAIAQANNISSVNLIFSGQRLCIPASGATSSIGTSTTGTVSTTTTSTSQSTSITGMIYQVFGSYGARAVNVATCESGLNPDAYNPISIDGSHAAGLFQILYPSTWAGTPEANSSPYDAWANIQAAHAIFVRDGYSWREWTCQP